MNAKETVEQLADFLTQRGWKVRIEEEETGHGYVSHWFFATGARYDGAISGMALKRTEPGARWRFGGVWYYPAIGPSRHFKTHLKARVAVDVYGRDYRGKAQMNRYENARTAIEIDVRNGHLDLNDEERCHEYVLVQAENMACYYRQTRLLFWEGELDCYESEARGMFDEAPGVDDILQMAAMLYYQDLYRGVLEDIRLEAVAP